MRKITSKEIRELKKITRAQRDEIIQLHAKINELETQLVESRAKEGKGCLETVIESIGDAISNICNVFSEMSPEELAEHRAFDDADADEIIIEEDGDDQ